MSVKYIKDHKTQETVYPIIKSDCIIDAFSINDLEIDKLFEDSLSVSKHLKGMSYLNLQGLTHYHSKIKDYLNNIPEVDLSDYATEAYVDLKIANLDIPILNNTKIKEEIVDNTDGVYYFTTDTHEIYINGESYGGNITAEDVETLPEEGIIVLAVVFVKNCILDSNSSFTIKPNYKYIFGERSALTISLEPVTDSSIVNHYMFEFTSGSTATTLSLPASIKWTTEPSIKPNKIYLISIENNLGVIQEWE